MFSFLQHNTWDNWNVDSSGSIEKAKDVADCNPDKDEHDIGDPDLEMWLIPSFVLYVYYWLWSLSSELIIIQNKNS